MPTHYQGSPHEVLALDTFVKLTRATNSLLARIHRRSPRGSLTPTQFGVLETLYHLGPLCQRQISAKLLLSTGNITHVIDILEQRGLVQRERDTNDRRYITVSLTPAGSTLIGQIFPQHASLVAREMEILTPDEQATLGSLCRKLGKNNHEHTSKGATNVLEN